jgi:hypothetical protein
LFRKDSQKENIIQNFRFDKYLKSKNTPNFTDEILILDCYGRTETPKQQKEKISWLGYLYNLAWGILFRTFLLVFGTREVGRINYLFIKV